MPRDIKDWVKGSRITTFSYKDVSSGKSVVDYYGGDVSGAYFLSQNQFWSANVRSGVGTVGSGARADEDFDIEFEKSRVIEGVCLVNVPFGINDSGTAGSMFARIKIRKWDGTTETELADGDSQPFSWTGAAAYHFTIKLVKVDIPKTKFKKGETLRVTIELYTIGGNAGDAIYLCHDPKDRAIPNDSDSIPSVMVVQVPFIGE